MLIKQTFSTLYLAPLNFISHFCAMKETLDTGFYSPILPVFSFNKIVFYFKLKLNFTFSSFSFCIHKEDIKELLQ